MFKVISNILTLPFTLFIYGVGYGVFICLYLQIALVPTAFLALLSIALFEYFPADTALNYIYAFCGFGFVLGVMWAEHIRKKYSIFGFHGYLLNHPEIDGWQKPSKGIVFRNGNLTSQ